MPELPTLGSHKLASTVCLLTTRERFGMLRAALVFSTDVPVLIPLLASLISGQLVDVLNALTNASLPTGVGLDYPRGCRPPPSGRALWSASGCTRSSRALIES
jgi:hypothetical protein